MTKSPTKTTKDTDTQRSSQNSTLLMAIFAAILITLPLGYVLGSQRAGEPDEAPLITTDSNEHTHATATVHSHDQFAIADGVAAPSVELFVTEDAKSGWNLTMDVENMTFSPENVNSEHIVGEGHAHLWIDGEKLTRLYSADYYIGELEEGEHEIRVTLNNNMHDDYSVDGVVISDSVTVVDSHHSDE